MTTAKTVSLDRTLTALAQARAKLEEVATLIESVEPSLTLKGARPVVTPLRQAWLDCEEPLLELRGAILTLEERAIAGVTGYECVELLGC